MEKMRNIIRLTEVPSNIIEEAIIIFKDNKKAKSYEFSNKFKKQNEENMEDKNYVVKEAELIISNYLEETEDKNLAVNKKVKKWKYISACLGALLFVSIIL